MAQNALVWTQSQHLEFIALNILATRNLLPVGDCIHSFYRLLNTTLQKSVQNISDQFYMTDLLNTSVVYNLYMQTGARSRSAELDCRFCPFKLEGTKIFIHIHIYKYHKCIAPAYGKLTRINTRKNAVFQDTTQLVS